MESEHVDPKRNESSTKTRFPCYCTCLKLSLSSFPLHIQCRIISCDSKLNDESLILCMVLFVLFLWNYSLIVVTHEKGPRYTQYSVKPTISGFTSVTKIKNGKTTQIILPDLTGTHLGIQNLTLLHKGKSGVYIRIIIII